jgi:hypothetical protein
MFAVFFLLLAAHRTEPANARAEGTANNIRSLSPYPASSPYPSDIVTDKFEVIDADFAKGVVAFKHTYHLVEPPAEEEDVDEAARLLRCEYPGFETMPNSGLTYGIYDLARDQLRSVYTVYRSTFTKCSSSEESQATLLLARKQIAAAGLNPDGHAQVVALSPPSKGLQEIPLTLSGKPRAFRSTTVWHDAEGDDTRRTRCGKEEGVSMGQIEVADHHKGRAIWFRCQRDTYYDMSGGTFIYPQAIVRGDKIVFVEEFRFFTHDRTERDREIWSFTKVLKP